MLGELLDELTEFLGLNSIMRQCFGARRRKNLDDAATEKIICNADQTSRSYSMCKQSMSWVEKARIKNDKPIILGYTVIGKRVDKSQFLGNIITKEARCCWVRYLKLIKIVQ
jgi:hypothetical protein